MKNQAIRRKAAMEGVRLWQIGEALGMDDSRFSRLLRKELPEEEQKKLLAIIEKLATREAK